MPTLTLEEAEDMLDRVQKSEVYQRGFQHAVQHAQDLRATITKFKSNAKMAEALEKAGGVMLSEGSVFKTCDPLPPPDICILKLNGRRVELVKNEAFIFDADAKDTEDHLSGTCAADTMQQVQNWFGEHGAKPEGGK